MGIIYLAKNKENAKIYIGKTELTLEERRAHHLKICWARKSRFYSALRYHAERFEWSILEICENSKLNSREKFWIKELDSLNPNVGYNMTAGGDGGDIISSLPNSNEIRQRQVDAVKRANPNRKLRPIKEVWIERFGIEEAESRYNELLKRRAKAISESKQGRKYTKEHRAAISRSLTGRKLDREHVKKIRQHTSEPRVQFTPEQEKQIILAYETKSLKQVARDMKVSPSVIKRVLAKHNVVILKRKNQYG